MDPLLIVDLLVKFSVASYIAYNFRKKGETKYKYYTIKSLIGEDALINLLQCVKFSEEQKNKLFMINIYNDHSTVKISVILDTFFDIPKVNVISATENVKSAISFNNKLDIYLDQDKLQDFDFEELEYEGFYISVKEV